MGNHLEKSGKTSAFGRFGWMVVVTVMMSTGTAIAAEPTTEDRIFGAAVGGATGAAGGAAAGAMSERAKIARSLGIVVPPRTPAQLKDAAGRKSFNRNYYKSLSSSEAAQHRKAVAKARADLAAKQQRTGRIEARRQAKAQRRIQALRKQNPDLARDLQKQRAQGDAFNKRRAAELKRRKNIRALKKASGNKRTKTSTKTLAKRKPAARTATRNARTAKNARKMRRANKSRKMAKATARTARLGRTARGALAGGAVGMAAGAALGVRPPDAVDAAMFAGGIVTDPKSAPRRINKAARGGVRMVGTAARTITNPKRMVNNVGSAVSGLGRSLGLSRSKKTYRKKSTRYSKRSTRYSKKSTRYSPKRTYRRTHDYGVSRTSKRKGRKLSVGKFFKRTFTKRKTYRKGAKKKKPLLSLYRRR